MNAPFIPDRRRLLKGSGALIVSFSLSGAFAQEKNPQGTPPAPKLPGSLEKSPYLDSWIRIDADGGITAFTGKAELDTVPEKIEVHIINRPGMPFLGSGETGQGPAAAAIANGIANATGKRLRDLPLTRKRIKDAIDA